MRGRMAPMKIALTVVPWSRRRSRRRTPIIREQVPCTSLMCSVHDSLLFMTNPGWWWCLTWGIETPLMVTRCPVAFPMCRCSPFSALKSMPQLSGHSAATSKSAEILAQLSLESELAAFCSTRWDQVLYRRTYAHFFPGVFQQLRDIHFESQGTPFQPQENNQHWRALSHGR